MPDLNMIEAAPTEIFAHLAAEAAPDPEKVLLYKALSTMAMQIDAIEDDVSSLKMAIEHGV